MIRFDVSTKENIKDHNPKITQIHNDPYIILTTVCLGSGKTNVLFNLMNHQSKINEIYIHPKDP